MPFSLKSSLVGTTIGTKFIAGKPSWSPAMTNDALDRPRADVERPRLPYLRIGLVMSLTGLGRSTIYRLMADDQFPPPVDLLVLAVFQVPLKDPPPGARTKVPSPRSPSGCS